MWGNHKVLTRSKRERVQPRVDWPPNQLHINPTPWKHDLHI
jgi:hypothetical protein